MGKDLTIKSIEGGHLVTVDGKTQFCKTDDEVEKAVAKHLRKPTEFREVPGDAKITKRDD